MPVDHRERILGLAKVGPLMPMQVAKALNTDSLMASAMLAELVTNNKLKVSSLKVGSSPLYYLPESKEKLVGYINYLNDKEQKAVKFLQEKLVLREKDLDPLTRVCLKNAKDFAYPLEVVYENQTELFWKWFLVTDQEAEMKIKALLTKKEPEPQKEEKPIVKEKPAAKPKRAGRKKAEKPDAKQSHLAGKAETKEEKDLEDSEKEEHKEEAKPKEKLPVSLINPFAQKLEAFMKANNITISEQISAKKNEFELIVEVPSPVGPISHYCSAKSKKITDAEVSQAFVQGQLRKLPVLLLVNGEVTKKAEEILGSLKGIVKKEI